MAAGEAFFEQFIDDYFSECDEHLATVRRVLLAIEGDARPQAAPLQELARALHTLKGLSGMVGLATAETIAHAMEDTVRALASREDVPSVLLELLFDGARALEAAIESRRAGTEPPLAGPYVDQVRQVIGMLAGASDAGSALVTSGTSSALAIRRSLPTVYRFEFLPSAELAQRGIGVEMVRRRLESIGEITTTVPRVQSGGRLTFEFVVAVREGTAPDESWHNDGLSWTMAANVPEEPSAAEPPRAGEPRAHATNVVRVDLARLDDLMRMVGELVVTRSRLEESISALERDGRAGAMDDLTETNERLERQLRLIREGVMRIRLVPVGEVFERMRFAMRDIARETGKTIHLEFSGQDTEIDKLVVDRMLEPLLHLVRNSASHGIESPADRRAAGKPSEGTISLRARAAGDRIVLEVEDDGAGIDAGHVARRARELGMISHHDELLPDAVLDAICAPGFSTRETADMASGRGVGMAVVRSTIRALGGELFVHSVVGQGTRFTIELPLTLMITDALIVEIGDQSMAIPQVALREIVTLDESAVTRFENNEVLSYRERVVPLVNLRALFRLAAPSEPRRHVLIVGTDTHLAGLMVDRIVGLREIVVHPLADPLVSVPGVAGATELADGRVSLILDAGALVRNARDGNRRGQLRAPAPTELAPIASSREHVWS